MHYHLTSFDTYSIASIRYSGAPIAYAQLTVDLHEENSPLAAATNLVYQDALLAGCGDLDRAGFLDAVNRLGASVTVTISRGRLTLSMRSREQHFPKLLSLVLTALATPRFDEAELKRIRTLTKHELDLYRENARSRAHSLLIAQLFAPGDRRTGFTPEAIRKALPQVTRKRLLAHHARLHERFWYVTAGGSVEVEKRLRAVLKRTRARAVLSAHAPLHTPQPGRERLHLSSIPSKQNIEFSLGGPLPLTLHSPGYLPLVFGLAVLGNWGGFTGRLMSTVREKEGLTYGIYTRAESVTGSEEGYWRIMTFFSPEQAETGLTATLREVEKIHAHGITEDEHARFTTILATEQQLLLDSVVSATNDLHAFHVAGFSLEERAQHKERLTRVTREEVNNALRTYLDPAKMYLCGAGPVTPVQKVLEKRFGGRVN